MAEKSTPVGKVTETASPERIKGAMRKREVPSPKKALQGSVMNALKLPGLRKVLHTLAFARLVKVLRAIAGFVGVRALPVIALILGGWLFRRFRRRR
ncbi:hypothetical protein GCM10023191_086900 [Actinoallomurus oryzae]|uniref:Uncharacterized protein n=1 Tax=Actinoallomurus oryzae TaxID=502180 RepID=A0ABP8R280_9ACTN